MGGAKKTAVSQDWQCGRSVVILSGQDEAGTVGKGTHGVRACKGLSASLLPKNSKAFLYTTTKEANGGRMAAGR